ncbi:glucan endo-1,3-beta-glucosidase 5-like [Nicotiana sylvestris]|uniref:Glucan endo-1,3-beta-glucosidase 5-like n=1 Tax=Nicotiana sylvestris TaxID=4096 RepID=A0A1U7XZN0_NICSY|nr:PREDICTED: glucan endo-1,3-beta-glucosidase 5-like [Nicotiana sylvestris]
MNRKTILLFWISLGTLFSFNYVLVDSFVGINWGRMATQQLVPSMVVDLLLQNGIPELKLFSPSTNVLPAFANSSIGLSVTFQDFQLRRMNNSKDIYDWVGKNVKKHVDNGVDIRYLYVGNEPFTKRYEKRINDEVVYYLEEARKALDRHDLKHIKTTTAHFTDILTNVTKPSQGDFREDIKGKMLDLLKFLKEHNSPLVINIFPIYMLSTKQMPVDFAFFDRKNNSDYKIKDGPYIYKNIFTFTYDTLVSALTKAGYSDMEIIVGQVGWPTDGFPNANPKYAERYHRGLLRYLKRNEGTPLRPNKTINVYITALSDENRMVTQWGEYQRHWGIYRHDGSPKYKIDFSLKDRDEEPTTAKGTVKMPNRWCVYDHSVNAGNEKLMEQVNYACNSSDCTLLSPGATCENLNSTQRASFAFNMYFQMNSQQVDYCGFQGLGVITTDDPSTPNCRFPIEILSIDVVDNGAWKMASYNKDSNPTIIPLGLALSALFCIVLFLCLIMWF